MTVQISDDAIEDLNEGFLFYEAQEFGLGDYFLSNLRGDIEGLKVMGGIHQVLHDDYHRVLSRVFPYAIYYTFSDEIAIVWAIVDCRKNPSWIEAHIKGTE
ncbi:MAG: type II toxin-antitoxin system RelE/ParE family toxin [Lentisphaeria bacterium]|nr:type II toxin-antitoxin system RelE/ParE family toxin [Lentisphaeria bacterium]